MNGLKSFLIIANEIKDEGLQVSKEIEKKLLEKGATVRLVAGLSTEVIRGSLEGVEAVIVMGGDGTMLRVSHALVGTDVPVIGVNLGVVGFMTEVVVSKIDKMIDRLISGKYVLEERMMLTGSVDINSTSYKHEALNDVVLARENSLRLVTVEINVNDKYFDTIEADGIDFYASCEHHAFFENIFA